ncbi:translocation/assembly module TamB domain-containing protein [Comamonas humi]
MIALLGGAWWWSGQPDSLPRTLQLASRYLPAGQQLQFSDTTGTLRQGGHIGQLQWSSPTVAVEVADAQLGWDLSRVLQRELRFAPLRIARITATPTGVPSKDEPSEPLQQLALPLAELQLPFEIGEITWASESPLTLSDLRGTYRYQQGQHQLQLGHLGFADSHYRGTVDLQADAPMALQAQLQGDVQVPATERSKAMALQAQAQVSGTLSGADAELKASLQAHPADTAGDKDSAKPTRAQVDAVVYPWRPWPLGPASADLQAINLAAFAPQLPTTLLDGQLRFDKASEALLAQAAEIATKSEAVSAGGTNAKPEFDSKDQPTEGPLAALAASGPWALQVQLRNGQAGPWDRQRLPLDKLDATALWQGQRLALLPGAALELGQGRLQAQGHYQLDSGQLEARAELRQLRPALIDSRFDSNPLSGTATAAMQGEAIRFDVDIQGAGPARGKAAALSINRLLAQGQWQAPAIELQQLQLDALRAQVSAKALRFDTEAQAGQGQIEARLPGAQLTANAQAAARDGKGQVQLRIASAEELLQWARSLPMAGASIPKDIAARGTLEAQLQWSGGYADAMRQLRQAGLTAVSVPADAAQAKPFRLDAQLRVPQLQVQLGKEDVWQLQDSTVSVQGHLADLQAEAQAQARHGEQRFGGAVRLQAALDKSAQWKGRVSQLQARMALPPAPGAKAQSWQAELGQPVDFTLRQQNGLQATTSAGRLQVSGSEPGAAGIEWQPLTLALRGQSLRLQSSGKITGLPVRWAKAFTKPQPKADPQAIDPLDSDLVLQGDWDIQATDSLRAKLRIARQSGDLRLRAGTPLPANITVHSPNGQPGRIAAAVAEQSQQIVARIRTMQLDLNVEGQQLQAQLQWDSENAGNAQAQVRTQLAPWRGEIGSALLPGSAPLSGTLKARMPDLGIWASFAPPGWRVQGQLGADATLAGTVAEPNWSGSISADDMSIQSQLDGVDLRNGKLRALLRGPELQLQSLHFDGGKGSRARVPGYSGNLTDAPTDGGSLDASGTIRWEQAAGGQSGASMDIRAQAKALQVLVRADRQVGISGEVRTQLSQGQLSMTGDLEVDRATIILADMSSPTLGSDVVVHSAKRRAAESKPEPEAKQEPAPAVTTAKPMVLNIGLSMGRDFALQGYGITTRLRGKLQVQNGSGGKPRITGDIRTEEGRYRAWSQVLDVEEGRIRFNGPYDNPSLDITAIRPNITVRAGVQISGSAQSPRVRLYSDPEMPDAEKLSWVVMGRDPSAGGAEAALAQQAALALLGGGKSSGGLTSGLASGLGLDEIGFKNDGGDASGSALSFGKRLSKDLYVTYEHSLAGALGTLYIFYDFSRNLQLRGSTGAAGAVDLIYTIRKD